MKTFIQRLWQIIRRIGYGYADILKKILFGQLLIIVLWGISFVVVFPLWQFSISLKTGYTFFVIVLFLSISLFLLGWKIIKGKHLKKIRTFCALLIQFVFIIFFFLNQNIFFIIPGALLSFEFLFFIILIKKDESLIFPGMVKILIFSAFIGFIYVISVLISREYLWLGIAAGIIYFLFFGYLVYERKKNFKKHILESASDKE